MKGYRWRSWEQRIDDLNRLSSLEAEKRTESPRALRPMAAFLGDLLLRGGWRAGRSGLRRAVFSSWQEMCVDLKLRQRNGGLSETHKTAPMPASSPGKEPNLVVCILTLNEERHIADVISSARLLTDDVVVVDSHSSDATPTIAEQNGARVWQHEFAGWGAQRNWSLDRLHLEYDDPWVLFLDADERLTSDLTREISERMRNDAGRYDAYFIAHTLVFAGRALRFGGFSGTEWARLLKASAGRHEERSVNDHLVLFPDKRVSRLRGRVLHLDVEDWERYIAKQNRYSTLEAQEVLKRARGEGTVTLRQAIANRTMRRRWLRENLWPAVLAKPIARWVQVYVLSGGFLDGHAGLCIATMQGWQELCIELKVEEFSRELRAA